MRVRDPDLESIVWHSGWYFEDDPNYPCDVLIKSGYYFDPVYQGLSNYWRWQRVLADGSLGPVQSGYGCFEKSHGNYEVKTVVTPK